MVCSVSFLNCVQAELLRLLSRVLTSDSGSQWGCRYDAYSFNVIPRMGEVVSGDRASYQYLVESVRKFPNQV